MASIPTHLARALTVLIALLVTLPQGAAAQSRLPDYVIDAYGAPPPVPAGPMSQQQQDDIRTAFDGSIAPVGSVSRNAWGTRQSEALDRLVASGDARVVWLITDLMRFSWDSSLSRELSDAAGALLQRTWQTSARWNEITDHLIAWDIPAPPDYLASKRAIFTNALHGWDRLFVPGEIDWRHVSWGGVPIDARPFGQTDRQCNCIPAADNPRVTSAEEATWLDDDDIIFGISINGEHRAYPRQIMEVREMVNDTLGGRDLGIPYCTLCGAAQAYFTDELPFGVKRPVLRTTGLLIRSNKVMYDITTHSVFDTFRGNAVTGPLADRGIVLQQASVVTSDWGSWKAAHPDTTVLAEELALGRDFDFRNGRDADGPIFPIGDVDPRLAVQEDVIGVIAPSGKAVAFPRGTALLALRAGQDIRLEGVHLQLEAGGLRATDAAGADLGSHEAFWFAWSQFYPGTALWTGS